MSGRRHERNASLTHTPARPSRSRGRLYRRFGGGAENRTPVHDTHSGSISRLSRAVLVSARTTPATRVSVSQEDCIPLRHTSVSRSVVPYVTSDPVPGTRTGRRRWLFRQRERNYWCHLSGVYPCLTRRGDRGLLSPSELSCRIQSPPYGVVRTYQCARCPPGPLVEYTRQKPGHEEPVANAMPRRPTAPGTLSSALHGRQATGPSGARAVRAPHLAAGPSRRCRRVCRRASCRAQAPARPSRGCSARSTS